MLTFKKSDGFDFFFATGERSESLNSIEIECDLFLGEILVPDCEGVDWLEII